MKVVAMVGGLGSQMLKYAFFLQIKKEKDSYIDTLPYQLTDMWNGYELERIFGIREKDLIDRYDADEIRQMREQHAYYQEEARNTMRKLEPDKKVIAFLRGYCYPDRANRLLEIMALIYNKGKRICRGPENIRDSYPFFYRTDRVSVYYDEFNHVSDRYIGGAKKREALKKVFRFPELAEKENKEISDLMGSSESVALHIRRSDHMYDNGELFRNGYFQKAVRFIKENTDSPLFFIFSEEPDWCRANRRELGFQEEDSLYFIDWNKGADSYKDMQLMTYCRHNILAISSFGWWGYYLSKRENKLVCAPKGYWLEVPVHY